MRKQNLKILTFVPSLAHPQLQLPLLLLVTPSGEPPCAIAAAVAAITLSARSPSAPPRPPPPPSKLLKYSKSIDGFPVEDTTMTYKEKAKQREEGETMPGEVQLRKI